MRSAAVFIGAVLCALGLLSHKGLRGLVARDSGALQGGLGAPGAPDLALTGCRVDDSKEPAAARPAKRPDSRLSSSCGASSQVSSNPEGPSAGCSPGKERLKTGCSL